MKIIKLYVAICCFIFGFTACETYGDAEVEYSSIALMSGEWVVDVVNSVTNTTVRTVVYTYETADASTSEMWLSFGTTMPAISALPYRVKGKVDIDMGKKTFSINEVSNVFYTQSVELNKYDPERNAIRTNLGTKFSIKDGAIVMNGVETLTGHKADGISFKLSTDKDPAVVYSVTGFRRTGWEEDEE